MNSAAACHEFGGDWEPQKTDFFRRPPEVEDDADGLYKLASDNEENYSVKSIKIHIVRHGVVHNPEKIFYGRITKHRLNADGEGQSRRVGAYLAANCPGIGAVYADFAGNEHEVGAADWACLKLRSKRKSDGEVVGLQFTGDDVADHTCRSTLQASLGRK